MNKETAEQIENELMHIVDSLNLKKIKSNYSVSVVAKQRKAVIYLGKTIILINIKPLLIVIYSAQSKWNKFESVDQANEFINSLNP